MDTKVCKKCNIEKDLDSFSINSSNKDGRETRCRECKRNERGNKRKNINNITDANSWLEENYPKYSIIEWAGNSKDTSIFLDKERNVQFEYSFSRFKDKITKNPNRTFNASTAERIRKSRATMVERYGESHPLKISEFSKKQKSTMREKYGVDNAMLNDELKQRQVATLMSNYGVDNPLKSLELRNKQLDTMKERYGVSHPYQVPAVAEKAAEKAQETKIKTGKTKVYKKKTLKEWAEELGVSYSFIQKVVAAGGLEQIDEISTTYNLIESKIANFANERNLSFLYNKSIPNIPGIYRPDFTFQDLKLVIECDGLYWHSDMIIKDHKYHIKKKKFYDEHGYCSLFFREDEIKNKFAIVKSIIDNRLNRNERIFARKCKILEIDHLSANDFFSLNHLMGKGSGRTYALVHDGNIVAAIQVKWKSLNDRSLEISRFCTKNGTSVVGGYSKLIKHAIKKEEPGSIITFVDRRYGEGSYLTSFGFQLENEDVSFMWTDGMNTFHRMKFPGNSGYDMGLVKIWDCGQAKYVLPLAHMPYLP